MCNGIHVFFSTPVYFYSSVKKIAAVDSVYAYVHKSQYPCHKMSY
jgi:hypothetical protein